MNGNFSTRPAEIRDSNMVLYCPQYLCLFGIVVECIPSIHDPGKMLVLPNRLLYSVLSTSDQFFFSVNFMSSTYTDKNDRVRIGIPNWKPYLLPTYVNRIFSNCLSHNSPAKRRRADSFQEERLGLGYWTMI